MLVLVAATAWFVTHPRPLPTTSAEVTGATPVDVPIYVRVYSAGLDGERTLTVRDVDLTPTGDVDVDVTAWVCRGGSPEVTTDADQLCEALEAAEGADLGPADSVLLELRSERAGAVRLDDVEMSFRDDLQWATDPVGPTVVVTFLER